MVDSGLAFVGLGSVGLIPFVVVVADLAISVRVCGSVFGGFEFGGFDLQLLVWWLLVWHFLV